MSQKPLHGTACKVCRRRGRKCDRTLPTCLSCERRGVACEGYITRWPGVAARGKLAGKSIPVTDKSVANSRANPRRPRLALPTVTLNENTSPANHSSQGVETMIASQHSFPSTSFLGDTDIIIDDKDMEKLVNHCMIPQPSHFPLDLLTLKCADIEDLSSIFFLGDGPGDNPTFRYVLPLMSSVPTIRYAIAASASCHLAARISDETLQQKSLYLRVRATHFLRERLKDPMTATDQATLASILTLAQVDMCSGDCIEFETHLRAAAAIIRGRHNNDYENRYYFEQRTVWIDIISSTSSTRLPNFTLEEIKASLGRFSNAGSREWSYDVFPCPVDLFEMLVDVTMLYKSQPKRADPTREDRDDVDHMMERLGKWKLPKKLCGPRKHMVEIWRLGIMAYLGRLFPSAAHMIDMSALTSQIIHHADLIPPASPWSYALLWSIFQVGVSLGDEGFREKAWIESRLRLAHSAVGCRHFSNALETLQFVWDNHVDYASLAAGSYGRTIMLG